MLITMHATSAANVVATAVRNSSDGQKLGLKNPDHMPAPSSQRPGVSCQARIQNRLIHAAIA
jgi:hypothetical protein